MIFITPISTESNYTDYYGPQAPTFASHYLHDNLEHWAAQEQRHSRALEEAIQREVMVEAVQSPVVKAAVSFSSVSAPSYPTMTPYSCPSVSSLDRAALRVIQHEREQERRAAHRRRQQEQERVRALALQRQLDQEHRKQERAVALAIHQEQQRLQAEAIAHKRQQEHDKLLAFAAAHERRKQACQRQEAQALAVVAAHAAARHHVLKVREGQEKASGVAAARQRAEAERRLRAKQRAQAEQQQVQEQQLHALAEAVYELLNTSSKQDHEQVPVPQSTVQFGTQFASAPSAPKAAPLFPASLNTKPQDRSQTEYDNEVQAALHSLLSNLSPTVSSVQPAPVVAKPRPSRVRDVASFESKLEERLRTEPDPDVRASLAAMLGKLSGNAEPEQKQMHEKVDRKGKAREMPAVPFPQAAPVSSTPSAVSEHKQEERKEDEKGPETLKERLEIRKGKETDKELQDALNSLLSKLFGAPVEFEVRREREEKVRPQVPETKLASSEPTQAKSASEEPVKPSTEESKEGAKLHRTPALSPAVAQKLLELFRSRRARKLSLSTIQQIEDTLKKLRETFVFPSHLDFPADEPSTIINNSTPVVETSSSSSRSVSPITDSEFGLAYTPNNKPIHTYEHALNNLLTKLDAIESGGDSMVRGRRKEVVGGVERALRDVLRKVEESRERADRQAKKDQEVNVDEEVGAPLQETSDAVAVVEEPVIVENLEEVQATAVVEQPQEQTTAVLESLEPAPIDELADVTSPSEPIPIPDLVDAAAAEPTIVGESTSSEGLTPVEAPPVTPLVEPELDTSAPIETLEPTAVTEPVLVVEKRPQENTLDVHQAQETIVALESLVETAQVVTVPSTESRPVSPEHQDQPPSPLADSAVDLPQVEVPAPAAAQAVLEPEITVTEDSAKATMVEKPQPTESPFTAPAQDAAENYLSSPSATTHLPIVVSESESESETYLLQPGASPLPDPEPKKSKDLDSQAEETIALSSDDDIEIVHEHEALSEGDDSEKDDWSEVED